MSTTTLAAAGESEVIVHHFGAHVTSWKNAAGREMIYTSPTAIYDGSKAIRGGIPVCFPQFGKKGPLKQHGFARNMIWSVDSTSTQADRAAVRLVLNDTEETRTTEWPHSFQVALNIFLAPDGNSITLDFEVSNKNTNGEAINFTMALHSYFTCDPHTTILDGFDGLSYEDNVEPDETSKVKKQSSTIGFGKEVDRVYLSTPDQINLATANLVVSKENMPDAVVWNPYVEKATALSDMPDDGWKHFICIEPARVATPAVVEPGNTWACRLQLESIL